MTDHPRAPRRPLECCRRLRARTGKRRAATGAATAARPVAKRRPVRGLARRVSRTLVGCLRDAARARRQCERRRGHHARCLAAAIRATAGHIAVCNASHDGERPAICALEVVDRHIGLRINQWLMTSRDPASTACPHRPARGEPVRERSGGYRNRRSAWAATASHMRSECPPRR